MKMELQASVICALITGVLASVITKYDFIQQEGNFSELVMLQCQLRGHGNSSSCAVRLNTTTFNENNKTSERCELLNFDWCYTPILEPGFTYMGKSVVSLGLERKMPKLVNALRFTGGSIRNILIPVKVGAQISVKFTAPQNTFKSIYVMVGFQNATNGLIYSKTFYESDSLIPSERTAVVADFDVTQVNLHFKGLIYNSGNIGPVTDITKFQFRMSGSVYGILHQISYIAAPYGN